METDDKKNRGFRIVVIIALLISIVCVSYAYAAYTSILKIQGTGTVLADVWDIHFENMDSGAAYGFAELPKTGKLAIINPLTVSGHMGNLSKPGDIIRYTWNVKNSGEIDATLTTIVRQKLTCTPAKDSEATQAEANSLCQDLKLTISYDGVNVVSSNGVETSGTDLSQDLLMNESKPVTMELKWDNNSTVKVAGAVDVSIGSHTFTYIQKDRN